MEDCYFYLSCRLELKAEAEVTILHGCFSRFSNCANGTKSRKTSHIKTKYTFDFPKFPDFCLSKNSFFHVFNKFKEATMKNIFWSAILFLHMFLFLGEIKFDGTTGKLKLDLTRRLNYQQGHNSLYSFANVKKGYSFLSSNGEFKKFCK